VRKLKRLSRKGYKARKEESHSITREFEAADLEGWDEY
jgi:hypothetical protein